MGFVWMDVASSWRPYVVLRMTGADLIYTSMYVYFDKK